MKPMIALQPLGRTGHESTGLLFGAAAIGNVDQDEADQTMELIREHGINHIDTAASYGDAELRLGPWMESRRVTVLSCHKDRRAHSHGGVRRDRALAGTVGRRPVGSDSTAQPRR